MTTTETNNGISPNKKYRLEVKESFYIEFEKTLTQIPYFDFYLDGRFETDGTDEVGEFRIRGNFKDNLIKFTKEYIGQHSVFYEGCFNKNKIDMYYFFDQEEEESEEAKKEMTNQIITGKNFNAGIVFNCQAYETEHSDYTKKKHIFLFENSNENQKNEQAGLLFEEAGVFEIKIKPEYAIGLENLSLSDDPKCKLVVIEINRNEKCLNELKILVLREKDNCIIKFQDFEKEE